MPPGEKPSIKQMSSKSTYNMNAVNENLLERGEEERRVKKKGENTQNSVIHIPNLDFGDITRLLATKKRKSACKI